MFVEPKVYHVGYTCIDLDGMCDYLRDTGNQSFIADMHEAKKAGLSDGEILTSFMAKICYASLSEGHNLNLTGTRSIEGNLRGTLAQGHGSVFEHAVLNFVATNVSRVFTHELVRHRAGTAFSQTSGRYVRTEQLKMVNDPILAEYGILADDEEEELRCDIETVMANMSRRIDALNADMATKKKLTSAARRWAPNGQANEIGFSVNLRALRHTIMMRTSRHAEWEIRNVFAQVYRIVKEKYPLLLSDAREEEVDGLVEVSGMKMQPY